MIEYRSGSDHRQKMPDPRQDREPLNTLTTKQRQIFSAIEGYCKATSEPCPGRYLARRMSLSHTTVRDHLRALHRKGWLRTPNSPSLPTDW